MQVNFNCNSAKPQFGMAVRTPKSPTAKRLLGVFLHLDKKVNLRGWEQLKKEQNKLSLFDIEIDQFTNYANIIDNKTGKIVDNYFPSPIGLTMINSFGSVKFPGRKLFARIFNPKKFLPYNVYLAAEKAKAMEAAALKADNIANKL